ncbi:VOC family protein [Streptomyces kunmingensis]|uniref:VOC family protein n=1 Tax=Streptomyces kunmingensis TaxID=68225 RepID=A0ABU6CIR0_9ACTN|nr:VOC family protein [Streptomyces kunmingensis]MEB3963856.1 VOC family protein [Streptomyces kunmingensis]
MAIAKLDVVALDCPEPRVLADFYAAVLGGTVAHTEEDGDWLVLKVPGGQLAFQRSPGYVPPVWPSTDHGQQFHLDLTVEDLDKGEKEVLALGATVLDNEDRSRSWRVYADPVGHPFCLCAG